MILAHVRFHIDSTSLCTSVRYCTVKVLPKGCAGNTKHHIIWCLQGPEGLSRTDWTTLLGFMFKSGGGGTAIKVFDEKGSQWCRSLTRSWSVFPGVIAFDNVSVALFLSAS